MGTNVRFYLKYDIKITLKSHIWRKNRYKGYFHLCPRLDFLQTLHINNSLYTNYENVFVELDS